ncbi:MAG: zinc ribbon domain-containing protein [Salinibacterium sp.]|nr:MAG: zinc ribbon domain-containing protein [Salinibacterium sp.]
MTSCRSCSSELKPEWKFCVYCGAPAIPGAIRPQAIAVPRVNSLALVAAALAAIGGAPALVFGHLAIKQISTSGERGMLLAKIATVAGYVWLVVWVLVIANLALHAR